MAGYFADNNTTNSPKKNDERNKPKSSSVLPVTIRQLHNAKQVAESFKIDGKLEPGFVSVVGQIMKLDIQTLYTNFELDDGTGRIDVKVYSDAQDKSDYHITQKGRWQEKVYLNVSGHLGLFSGVRVLLAFKVHTVEDANEITYHQLRAAYAHLVHEKGSSQDPNAMYNHTSKQIAPQQGTTANILELIKQCPDDIGATVEWIVANAGVTESKARECIQSLSADGWIFAVDDCNHWRAGDPQTA